MPLDNSEPKLSSDSVESTIRTYSTGPSYRTTPTDNDFPIYTPEESINDLPNDLSSVPWPGSTFIISSIVSGNVITLSDGQITMTRPGSRSHSIYWRCVEANGWLGFQILLRVDFWVMIDMEV